MELQYWHKKKNNFSFILASKRDLALEKSLQQLAFRTK
jgi:hypothetical protein